MCIKICHRHDMHAGQNHMRRLARLTQYSRENVIPIHTRTHTRTYIQMIVQLCTSKRALCINQYQDALYLLTLYNTCGFLQVATFRKTRHENLVLFMGACMKPPRLAIVTSLCKGNTLYTHIHLRKDKFTANKSVIVAQQISQVCQPSSILTTNAGNRIASQGVHGIKVCSVRTYLLVFAFTRQFLFIYNEQYR